MNLYRYFYGYYISVLLLYSICQKSDSIKLLKICVFMLFSKTAYKQPHRCYYNIAAHSFQWHFRYFCCTFYKNLTETFGFGKRLSSFNRIQAFCIPRQALYICISVLRGFLPSFCGYLPYLHEVSGYQTGNSVPISASLYCRM